MTGGQRCAVTALTAAVVAVGAWFIWGAIGVILGETSSIKPVSPQRRIEYWIDTVINWTQFK